MFYEFEPSMKPMFDGVVNNRNNWQSLSEKRQAEGNINYIPDGWDPCVLIIISIYNTYLKIIATYNTNYLNVIYRILHILLLRGRHLTNEKQKLYHSRMVGNPVYL